MWGAQFLHPVAAGHAQVVVFNLVGYGSVRGPVLVVGEHDDAQVQFGQQRYFGLHAGRAAGVPHFLVALHVAQMPAQAVGGEVSESCRAWA